MKDVLITSTVLILAVLLIRWLLRKTLSRRIQYGLWGLVLLRLLLPFHFSDTGFSVLSAADTLQTMVDGRIEIESGQPAGLRPAERTISSEAPARPREHGVQSAGNGIGTNAGYLVSDERSHTASRIVGTAAAPEILQMVWAAGMIAAGMFFLGSNFIFWRRLKRCRVPYFIEGYGMPAYLVCNGFLKSPCLFGGCVYLTPDAAASSQRLSHVLAHEKTHARHWDPLWALLRCVCLTVYWFDPLVWIAAAVSKTDCELACDEGTLARLGEDARISYGQTLLSLIPVRKDFGNPFIASTTMAAGKKQLKDRLIRITQPRRRSRQLLAAALAAVVLAGIAVVCTFTGSRVSATRSLSSADESLLRALTGEELRFFNEEFFNAPNGEFAYNIRNQFANPANLYKKPEDIDLLELLYLEGTQEVSDWELKALNAFDSGGTELVCPVYKLGVHEIDSILSQHTGLTLEKTNKVGLDGFNRVAGSDAYYMLHGDTNYRGNLFITSGTKEGSTVKLYYGGYYGDNDWYCVALEEQSGGGYWFVSNQACGRPAVQTALPDKEPDAVIPLDGLEPYPARAVTLEPHIGDFDDTYENRLENWDVEGHSVVVYCAVDGNIHAAIRDGETMQVFSPGLSENTALWPFLDLFGHSGFTVFYDGEIKPGTKGTCADYYYFTDEGVLVLMAGASCGTQWPLVLDLDGNGTDELVTENEIFFQRDGRLYRAGLEELAGDAYPAFGQGSAQWDKYSKCLTAGSADSEKNSVSGGWACCIYFDGENLLFYRQP